MRSKLLQTELKNFCSLFKSLPYVKFIFLFFTKHVEELTFKKKISKKLFESFFAIFLFF